MTRVFLLGGRGRRERAIAEPEVPRCLSCHAIVDSWIVLVCAGCVAAVLREVERARCAFDRRRGAAA